MMVAANALPKACNLPFSSLHGCVWRGNLDQRRRKIGMAMAVAARRPLIARAVAMKPRSFRTPLILAYLIPTTRLRNRFCDDPIKRGCQHAVFVNHGLGADFDESRLFSGRNRRWPTPPGDLDKRHAEMALVHSLKNCAGHRPGNLVISHRIINYSGIAFADRVFVHPTSGKIRDAVASRAKMASCHRGCLQDIGSLI
jgi:hypothetical protein